MEADARTIISVETIINAPVETVWKNWITPENIVVWNVASKDWHTPYAENDFRMDGKFRYRMEAKDGSAGFDFVGKYEELKIYEQITYTTDDGRKVKIIFTSADNQTKVMELFEAETENSIELQREGWQAILDNFKNYVEIRLEQISASKWKI
ncbi:polyketide cyclase [Flavobacterium sp. XN-5]|uniref:SRPBCC domain-containing protein n=1 Tax=Flavobacterium sp. XN-5 TaxID=2599390 RepID=UPI0011C7B19F|nr:SRPBCC domain-containing protein [Flavobacterium sp. XN-5]NGY37047.1 polyketide cyclase [Flavobacterium sp. XN-5]